MKKNIENVFVIAQKEFADNIHSTRFVTLLLILTSLIFSFSYRSVMNGHNLFPNGFIFVAQVIGLFLPLLGITLGFDAVVKERKSGSLNILLTHPVYRDSIISGKILGSLATLALAIGISVMASVGPVLIITGMQISFFELVRILIFAIITFIYISIFLGMSVLFSIVSKNTTNSFIYSLAAWINVCLVAGAIIAVTASVTTGQSIIDLGNNYHALEINSELKKLTPLHHYAETVTGHPGLSYGGVGSIGGNSKQSSGIFDSSSTLNQWFWDYWTNLVALVVAPIILFIVSFMVFLRKDITM